MNTALMRAAGLALALGTVGCAGDKCDQAPEIVSATVDPGTITAGDDVELTVEVMHFELAGHDADAGHDEDESAGHEDDGDAGHDEDAGCPSGHVHVYLDDLMTNPLAMPATSVSTLTIPADTTPGEHTLFARLQDLDHMIIEPQVVVEIDIMVE